MTSVTKLWPILTATHSYDKSISTFNRGAGQIIEAPILAYLIETRNGRILYDVGYDYNKINNPAQSAKYYNAALGFGAPEMVVRCGLPLVWRADRHGAADRVHPAGLYSRRGQELAEPRLHPDPACRVHEAGSRSGVGPLVP